MQPAAAPQATGNKSHKLGHRPLNRPHRRQRHRLAPGPRHQGRRRLRDRQSRAAPVRHVTDSLSADGRFKAREAVGHAFVDVQQHIDARLSGIAGQPLGVAGHGLVSGSGLALSAGFSRQAANGEPGFNEDWNCFHINSCLRSLGEG